MNARDRDQIRINGYSLDAAGKIEIHREPHERYAHEHCAVILMNVGDSKAAKEFTGKVITAVDEPGALVGQGRAGALMLFKLGDTYNVEVRDGGNTVHEFVFRDAPCLFIATADAEVTTVGYTRADTAFSIGDYTWRENRSPLNTRRDELAPLYPDISRRAYEAVDTFLRANGAGRWGPLAAPESFLDRVMREKAEREAAGIVDETPVDEDAELVAKASPDLRAGDGIFGMLVAEARKRLAERKTAA